MSTERGRNYEPRVEVDRVFTIDDLKAMWIAVTKGSGLPKPPEFPRFLRLNERWLEIFESTFRTDLEQVKLVKVAGNRVLVQEQNTSSKKLALSVQFNLASIDIGEHFAGSVHNHPLEATFSSNDMQTIITKSDAHRFHASFAGIVTPNYYYLAHRTGESVAVLESLFAPYILKIGGEHGASTQLHPDLGIEGYQMTDAIFKRLGIVVYRGARGKMLLERIV